MRSFRRILCTALVFLLVIILVSVAFMEVYFRTEYDFFQDASDRDAEAGTVDYVICGASHGFRAFNPDIIDGILGTHSYNLSGALMSMRGRYELLRLELERNPVKTVVIEVSYNTMTRVRAREGVEGDLYLMARVSRFTDRVRLFFSLFSAKELPDVYYKFLTEGIDATGSLLSGKKSDSAGQRIRGYLPTGERTEEFNTDYRSYFHQKSMSMKVDETDQEYLDKIMELCKEKDIQVILVTTPITKAYFCIYNNFDWSRKWYEDYAKKWDVPFVDFNLYKGKEQLFPDETMFYDKTHLNKAGSELFSRIFAETEKQLEEGEDVSGLFYQTYYEMQLTLDLD